jgi:peptide/nickel transport system substrate-binding protein
VAASLVPALAFRPATAAAADKSTFTVALTGNVDSLNPFLGVEAPSYEMWALMYDYLVGYSMKDMSPAPAQATKWETSTDGKTWTFHVRDGVKWSDGQPLTAADVAYTYNRVLSGGVEANNWSSYLNNVTKVTSPDASTVVLTLKKSNAVLPLLPIPIVPEHVWKNVSEKQMKSFGNEPTGGKPVVGSGPFRLAQGKTGGSTFTFEKNPDYWGGTPHVDQVVFRQYKADDPAVQALIKGEVDFVEDIPALQIRALKGKEGITAREGVSPYFDEIAFNTGARDPKTEKPLGDGNAALKDVKFRQALSHAVDTARVVKSAFQGAAERGTTIVPSTYGNYHWTPPKDEAYSFDLGKANQLLDEAGYKKGAGGKRMMPDGKPIGSLRLFARSDAKESIVTLDLFKEWLADLGIDSLVTVMDSSKLSEVIVEGNYDAFEWGWYVEPDPDSILADFTCAQRGGLSDSWYCDKAYDAMYDQQNSETDDTARTALIKQMQQKLYEEAPYIVTTYATIGEAFRSDRWACFQPQPDPGGVLLQQYGARNYSLLRPAKEAGSCSGVATAIGAGGARAQAAGEKDDGGGAGLIITGGLIAVIGAAGVLFFVRRRGTATERE